MAARVFISYRRSDSRDVAARLSDRLATAKAVKSLFLDVAEIAPGEAFPDRLERGLAECDTLLALIGTQWVGPQADGSTRIGRDDDFVRLEIARALSLDKRIIPVLLDGADLPAPESLPADIRDVTTRNALFLRHASFNQDYQILIDAIAGIKARGPLRRLADRWPWLVPVTRATMGVLAGLVLLLVIALVNNAVTGGRSLEAVLGSRALVILLALLVVGGAVGLALRRR